MCSGGSSLGDVPLEQGAAEAAHPRFLWPRHWAWKACFFPAASPTATRQKLGEYQVSPWSWRVAPLRSRPARSALLEIFWVCYAHVLPEKSGSEPPTSTCQSQPLRGIICQYEPPLRGRCIAAQSRRYAASPSLLSGAICTHAPIHHLLAIFDPSNLSHHSPHSCLHEK